MSVGRLGLFGAAELCGLYVYVLFGGGVFGKLVRSLISP